MSRYFLHIAFRGAPFHGWQSQPGVVTVQQTIEEALSTVLRHPTPIVGAGRTDAGVNARMMTAHFDTNADLSGDKAASFLKAVNTLCGRDIAISRLTSVAPDAHARFDATARTYHYYAATCKSPFDYQLSWLAPKGLDWDAMNKAAQLLLTTDDFTSFSKLHTDVKTNICHVTHARWHDVDATHKVFVITADRFLRNMVRAVVGTLVDVGRGKLTIPQFADIIAARNRCAAGTSMPGHALFLWQVDYPYPL